MAVWPNGKRTPPKFSSYWKEYDGVYADDHYGLDSYGYEFNCAIDDAVITRLGWNTYGGGGREIWYRLKNGDVILYYHNEYDVLVKVGDHVIEGQKLGIQSNTGRTKGTHLHMEVLLNGNREQRTNPLPYVTDLVANSKPTIEKEDDNMKASQVHWTRKKDSLTQRALFVPGTAYWLTWQETGSAIANGFSKNADAGPSTLITESMAGAMEKASLALLPNR